jgi:hypothetical protein
MAGEDDMNDGENGDAPDPELPEVGEGYPSIDFNTFVLSLSTSALMSMGEVPEPTTNELASNLPLARQTIDLIALLEEKTEGNLTGEEERLLSQVLYDLRMRFLEAAKKAAK